MDDLVGEFIAETREGLEALDSELVRFEQDPSNPELLGGVFRLIHTIKGACGFLGLTRLQTVAHAAENVLGGFRDGSLAVTSEAVSAVLDTVDLIRRILDALSVLGIEPDGDDSVLIARLEAVVNGAPAAPAARPTAAAPLIERLGGEATLDAAAEIAMPGLRADPVLQATFAGADVDYLQAALRDGLMAAAGGKGTAALERGLAEQAGAALDGSTILRAVEPVLAALGELEVHQAALAELWTLITPPEAAEAEAPASPPAQTDVESRDEAVAGPQSIRVSVDALENLMTVVSELVLIRNQLLQSLRLDPDSPFAGPLARLNQVTTELQEGVMTTRMQPISSVLGKLPRLVRDLSKDLGKEIELVVRGQETELDRQVLELIRDPLTHMIRNAADHGLEPATERLAAGKPAAGRVSVQARHEGGAIVIEVADDGRGLSPARIRDKALSGGLINPAQAAAMSDAEVQQLIFAPGFSTASQVTNVSGRGVGMDVVRSNIEKIGGLIELQSAEGAGTRLTVRIPLTLTIVSALIVGACGERFALPQSCVMELVSASGGSGRTIEHLHGAPVLRLRDRLLPLVSLGELLGLDASAEPAPDACIVVARVGEFTFGVTVDRVFDTEEIVVKPVATVLRHIKLYSGATILGDGSVILILDAKGLSLEANAGQAAIGAVEAATAAADPVELTALLVFNAGAGAPKAAPLARVARIEEVAADQLETVEGATVIQYRGGLMPVRGVDALPVAPWTGPARPMLVFAKGEDAVGVVADEIVDILEADLTAMRPGSGPGVAGSLVVAGRATELIEVDAYWRGAAPSEDATASLRSRSRRLLVVDQSPFCRLMLQPLLAQAGYEVSVAATPEEALRLHEAGEEFGLILAETSDAEDRARRFAAAFGQAERWRRTPFLGLSTLRAADRPDAPRLQQVELLDAVSAALAALETAA